MADIYLTKIERKTIFTRSLIYVLILFIVADMTVTGPFFVNFIPWLYILSILISIRGVDKVLTGIIGTFTVFVASVITNGGVNTTTVLSTLNTAIQLGLGMLSSAIIHEFVLQHRLVKYIKPKMKVMLILLLVVFTLLSIGITSTMHGDIITYLKSRNRFDEYISKTYDVEYKMKDVIYNRTFVGKYAFVVEVSGEEIYFKPVLTNAFKDVNREERLIAKNKALNMSLSSKISQIVNAKENLKENDFNFQYEYRKVGVIPDSLVVYITSNADNTDELYMEIASSITELSETEKNITDFVITINGISLHIAREETHLVTPEYIEGGLNIEDVDE